MATVRQVTAAVAVGVSAAALVHILRSRSRPSKTNRLFMYEVAFTREFARAAVATIGPGHFQVEKEYSYGAWDFVASAASPANKWLLFYAAHTGSVATGWIDRNSNVRNARFYPSGLLDFPFKLAAVDRRGYLLLMGFGESGPGTLIAFAQVLDDGAFVEWWRADRPDLPLPDGGPVGLSATHAWYVNDPPPGHGSTVYIFDVKHGQVLSARHWPEPLGGIVGDGNLLYLYFKDSLLTTEIHTVDSSGQLAVIKHTEADAEFHSVPFDRIASTPGAHLLYPYRALMDSGAVRVLSPDGFRLTKHTSNMDWPWHYYAEC